MGLPSLSFKTIINKSQQEFSVDTFPEDTSELLFILNFNAEILSMMFLR